MFSAKGIQKSQEFPTVIFAPLKDIEVKQPIDLNQFPMIQGPG
jgi:hypothetical protein